MMTEATLVPILLAAIASLSGVVGFLYLQISRRLESCEADREKLWSEILKLGGKKDVN